MFYKYLLVTKKSWADGLVVKTSDCSSEILGSILARPFFFGHRYGVSEIESTNEYEFYFGQISEILF